jgi:hypothetical protein
VSVIAIVFVFTVPLFAACVWRQHAGPLPLVGDGWARPTPRVWPVGMSQALAEFEAECPDGTPIFNEPVLGGFLIYNYPKLRVFIDGRCELYGEPFLRDFLAAWQNPEMVGRWQAQYGFRAALIEADSPLRGYFDKTDEWQLVAETPTAKFYRCRSAFPG